jgi:hypothetical protein
MNCLRICPLQYLTQDQMVADADKVKVKLSVCLTMHHAMKCIGGVEV